VDRATDLYLGGSCFEPRPGTRVSCGAYLWNISVPYKCLDIVTNYAQTYRFTYSPIYYSLITLLCDTVYSELLPDLLNKLYIKSEFVPVHDTKAYWGKEVRLHSFLTLVLGTSY